MTDIILKGYYPQTWKHARVVAILKPGKKATEPSSYRAISLLCCLYKLLERLILTRITPYIDSAIPVQQAGFRSRRDTTEQVLALTSHIEAGFEKKLKTGAVLIDLSAAYDTVWTGGLMLKLAKIIPCKKILNILSLMTGTRQFHVVLGGQKSKSRKIKNGVPQGSVIAPSLFNIYISDMPDTKSNKLGYADDWALTYQSTKWAEIEETLSADTTTLKEYFDVWYLKMNTTKSVTTAFHLNNHDANRTLKINVHGSTLPSEMNPKYLGVTLDKRLTYRKHLEGCANKIAKRNCILSKLARTTWGASQTVLRTSTIALCNSVAEYCAPVWTRSSHTQLIDIKLRESMRKIGGCLKSTPTQWLPVISSIAPPHIRREEANQKMIMKIEDMPDNIPLKQIFNSAPITSRLKSRKPFYKSKLEGFSANDKWREEWEENTPNGGDLIDDPVEPLPGFKTMQRKYWVTTNRLRTRHARTAYTLHKWNIRESPICQRCGGGPETTEHIVLQCPLTKLEGGFSTVHEADDKLVSWIDKLNLEV